MSNDLLFSMKDLENRFSDKLAGRILTGTRWEFKGKEEYLELLTKEDSPLVLGLTPFTPFTPCATIARRVISLRRAAKGLLIYRAQRVVAW